MLNKIEKYIKSKVYWKDYYKLEYKCIEKPSPIFHAPIPNEHIIRLTNTKSGKWVSETRYTDVLTDEILILQCDYLIKSFDKHKMYEVAE